MLCNLISGWWNKLTSMFFCRGWNHQWENLRLKSPCTFWYLVCRRVFSEWKIRSFEAGKLRSPSRLPDHRDLVHLLRSPGSYPSQLSPLGAAEAGQGVVARLFFLATVQINWGICVFEILNKYVYMFENVWYVSIYTYNSIYICNICIFVVHNIIWNLKNGRRKFRSQTAQKGGKEHIIIII